jgi:hypothetical protein
MQRRVFDTLVSWGGIVIVAVLVVAGALAFWGSSFANSNVHNQLARSLSSRMRHLVVGFSEQPPLWSAC